MKDVKKCPHCGAELPAAASFCPYCARSVIKSRHVEAPRRIPRQIRNGLALMLAAAAAGAALGYLYSEFRPQVLDGGAEILYQDQKEHYRLIFGWDGLANLPVDEMHQSVPEGTEETFTLSQCLFVSRTDTGEDLHEAFLSRVASCRAEFLDQEGAESPCSVSPVELSPDHVKSAALAASLSFTCDSPPSSVLEWTIRMKNGDIIRAHQTLRVSTCRNVEYYPEGYPADDPLAVLAPMNTAEQLQTLLDTLPSRYEPEDRIRIHLPPVVYGEDVTCEGMNVSFLGSGEQDTVFAEPLYIQREEDSGVTSSVDNISFTGSLSAAGLSANCRVHVTNCQFKYWETGLLASGDHAWLDVQNSVFEGNGTGFRFAGTGVRNLSSDYTGNVFQDNSTALLLEDIPDTGFSLELSGCRFSDNGTDINNRCGALLRIGGAVFN